MSWSVSASSKLESFATRLYSKRFQFAEKSLDLCDIHFVHWTLFIFRNEPACPIFAGYNAIQIDIPPIIWLIDCPRKIQPTHPWISFHISPLGSLFDKFGALIRQFLHRHILIHRGILNSQTHWLSSPSCIPSLWRRFY